MAKPTQSEGKEMPDLWQDKTVVTVCKAGINTGWNNVAVLERKKTPHSKWLRNREWPWLHQVEAEVTWSSQCGGGCCPSASTLSYDPARELILFHATRMPRATHETTNTSRTEKSPARGVGGSDHTLTRRKNTAQNCLNCYHYVSPHITKIAGTDKVILTAAGGTGLHKNITASENRLLLPPSPPLPRTWGIIGAQGMQSQHKNASRTSARKHPTDTATKFGDGLEARAGKLKIN